MQIAFVMVEHAYKLEFCILNEFELVKNRLLLKHLLLCNLKAFLISRYRVLN
jgi:hypothetical protein